MRVEAARMVFARAAAQAGGPAALGIRLGLSQRLIRHYIEGREPIPEPLLLRVIDLILAELPHPK